MRSNTERRIAAAVERVTERTSLLASLLVVAALTIAAAGVLVPLAS